MTYDENEHRSIWSEVFFVGFLSFCFVVFLLEIQP